MTLLTHSLQSYLSARQKELQIISDHIWSGDTKSNHTGVGVWVFLTTCFLLIRGVSCRLRSRSRATPSCWRRCSELEGWHPGRPWVRHTRAVVRRSSSPTPVPVSPSRDEGYPVVSADSLAIANTHGITRWCLRYNTAQYTMYTARFNTAREAIFTMHLNSMLCSLAELEESLHHKIRCIMTYVEKNNGRLVVCSFRNYAYRAC